MLKLSSVCEIDIRGWMDGRDELSQFQITFPEKFVTYTHNTKKAKPRG